MKRKKQRTSATGNNMKESQSIMLSERNSTQKSTYFIIPLMQCQKQAKLRYSAESQNSGLPLGGWVKGGERYCLKRYTRDAPWELKIFCILIWTVFIQLYLYVKIYPAIYLRFVYFTVCYTPIKLFLKDLCICTYS